MGESDSRHCVRISDWVLFHLCHSYFNICVVLFGCIQVQIQHKKVDLSKVTSKCGSKDNIKHKPGRHLMILEMKTASQMAPYPLHSTLLLTRVSLGLLKKSGPYR